jgi:hypothetical protein
MLDTDNLYKQWYSSVYIALQKYKMGVTFTKRNIDNSGLGTEKEILLQYQPSPLALIPALSYFRETMCLYHVVTRKSFHKVPNSAPRCCMKWNKQGQEKEY